MFANVQFDTTATLSSNARSPPRRESPNSEPSARTRAVSKHAIPSTCRAMPYMGARVLHRVVRCARRSVSEHAPAARDIRIPARAQHFSPAAVDRARVQRPFGAAERHAAQRVELQILVCGLLLSVHHSHPLEIAARLRMQPPAPVQLHPASGPVVLIHANPRQVELVLAGPGVAPCFAAHPDSVGIGGQAPAPVSSSDHRVGEV
eukprot:588619-Rhodomonas_salina.1